MRWIAVLLLLAPACVFAHRHHEASSAGAFLVDLAVVGRDLRVTSCSIDSDVARTIVVVIVPVGDTERTPRSTAMTTGACTARRIPLPAHIPKGPP